MYIKLKWKTYITPFLTIIIIIMVRKINVNNYEKHIELLNNTIKERISIYENKIKELLIEHLSTNCFILSSNSILFTIFFEIV